MSIKKDETEALNRLEANISRVNHLLNAYIAFTNYIDDYFEYRCKSEQDQKYVHDGLEILTNRLLKIVKHEHEPGSCPNCHSRNTDDTPLLHVGDGVYELSCSCNECGNEYYDYQEVNGDYCSKPVDWKP